LFIGALGVFGTLAATTVIEGDASLKPILFYATTLN